MTQPLNRRFVRAGRLREMPSAANDWLDEAPTPEPGEGRVRTRRLSADPYMRRANHGRRTTVGEALMRVAAALEAAS